MVALRFLKLVPSSAELVYDYFLPSGLTQSSIQTPITYDTKFVAILALCKKIALLSMIRIHYSFICHQSESDRVVA
jgi:hypothetical protein